MASGQSGSQPSGQPGEMGCSVIIQAVGLLSILVAIASLAWGVLQFKEQQSDSAHMQATQVAVTQAQALDQQRQTTLDTYLDRIQDMLLHDNLSINSNAQAIAAARTFTVLRYLDGNRKAYLIRYLYDVYLIGYVDANGSLQKPIINVYGLDLSGAVFASAIQPNLKGVNLSDDNLYRANLSGVNLTRAVLSGADLTRADLRGTNLSGAILCGADLSGATYNTKTIQVTDVQGNTLIIRPTQWRGARYNLEPIQATDAQGNPVTIRPTQWPQGFNPKAAGVTTTSNVNDCY